MPHPMFLSRRTFTTAAATLPFALKAMALTPPAQYVFIGTQDGEGIYRHTWNAVTGELGPEELAVPTERPNFFALHPTKPLLLSTNEREGDRATLSSFRIDARDGTLTLLNHAGTHGDDPCYVSLDRTGRLAFAANYSGGSLAVLPVNISGHLGSVTAFFDGRTDPQRGPTGPQKDRQDAAHFHCATVSPSNRYVIACDLGTDSIFVFPIHPGHAQTLGKPQRVAARFGSGPRHVAFHPNGRWMYCIHELNCTVDLFDWNEFPTYVSLQAREGSTVSTLSPGASLQGNTAAELVLSPDGRFAYTCVRGTNELVTFRLDPTTGRLTEHQRLSCGGKTPRLIAFDPTHRWLLCANQDSTFVTVFAHDPAKGLHDPNFRSFPANSPMCFAFV